MRPVSQRFLDAVVNDHTVVVAGSIARGGATVIERLQITGGSVTLDARSAIRGRCQVTIAGTPDVIPRLGTDALTPYGSEISLSRGIQFPDGTQELVPLGVFRVEDVNVSEDSDGVTVTVEGRDRAAQVAEAKFLEPYVQDDGVNAVDAIVAMVLAGVPGLAVSADPTTELTTKLVHGEGQDRWAKALERAVSLGMEAYMGDVGELVIRTVPDPAAAPVFSIVDGAGGTLVRATKRWTRKGGFNAVVITGENTSNTTPARGEALDLDPSSLTYWGTDDAPGPYGQVPIFEQSPLVRTDSQATAMAVGKLRRKLGGSNEVTFGSVPNPALRPGDVGLVRRDRIGTNETHVLDQVVIPLDETTTLSGVTRSRQVA